MIILKIFKKVYVLLIMSLLLLMAGTLVVYAHPNASEHNKELEAVLFEQGYSIYQSTEIKQAVKALEGASYLTIDQFQGDGLNTYLELKGYGIRGLPLKFSSIDYSEDPMGNGARITANTHRQFTHQGWDRDYNNSKSVQKFWNSRRKVLLATVNTIFNFDDKSIIGYSEKANSLAGIIYYVHILGDYDEADNYKKIALLTDIAGRSDQNDMITALRSYAQILFKDQNKTMDYKDLMEGLDRIEEDASRLVNSTGGVNSDEEFQEYHQCALDLLDLLTNHIPNLLKKEKYFAQVFYP